MSGDHFSSFNPRSSFQEQKVYVTNRLREEAEAVWRCIGENNGHFYVFYTATSPGNATTVARYSRLTPDQADAGSGQIIFQTAHPIGNHNAGMIAFSREHRAATCRTDSGSTL